jgi:hypothetical protein
MAAASILQLIAGTEPDAVLPIPQLLIRESSQAPRLEASQVRL